jgi:tape measure domain-containing protein
MAGSVGELYADVMLRFDKFDSAISQIESKMQSMGKRTAKVVKPIGDAMDTVNERMKLVGTSGVTGLGKVNTAFSGLNKQLHQFSGNVWNVYTSLKDIARVATGILMSQFIYQGILMPIRQSWSELWQFNQELEKTHVSLSYFLEDAKNINSFVFAMENLAATTPYQFSELSSASKMFFRYGFSEKQILPMVSLIADMGAATGATTDQINHLAMAFGQVLAKGRLVSEEAKRQIGQILPINKILMEELGITAEQLGDVYVSAKDGLTAIFNWVRKNYEGAAAKMEQTTQGLISSIKDYLLFLGRDLTAGFFENVRGLLTTIRDTLSEARQAFKESGLEGLLLSLFPKDMALSLYQLVYVFKELGRALLQVWQALEPVRHELMQVTITLVKFAASGFATFIRILEAVIRAAMTASPVIRTLTAAIAGISIAWTAAQALLGLAGAMATIVRFISSVFAPGVLKAIWVISALVGVLGGILLSFPKVRNFVSNLGATFARVFGIQIPASIGATKAALGGGTNYDVDFSDIEEGFQDVGDSAADAGKKIKDTFLASFDEVYTIPDKLDATGGGAGNFEMPDFEDLGDLGGIGSGLEDLTTKVKAFSFTWAELADILKRTGKLIWDNLKNTAVAIWETIKAIFLPFDKIPLTLASLISPIVKTVSGLVFAVINSIIILMPKVIETVSLFISTLLNSFSKYGYENFAGIALVLAGMFTKIVVNLSTIAVASANMIGDSFIIQLKFKLAQSITTLGIAIAEDLGKMFLSIAHSTGIPAVQRWATTAATNLAAWATNQTKLVVDSADYLIQEKQKESMEKNGKIIQDGVDGILTTVSDMSKMISEETQIYIEKTGPMWVKFGNEVVTLWDGTGTELLGVWEKFFSDTDTTWKTWWDESGKPLWEGTGADIVEVWSNWQKMTKEEFVIYWNDIVGIHKKYGDEATNATQESMGEIQPWMVTHYGKIEKTTKDTLGEIPGWIKTQYGYVKANVTTELTNTEKNVETSMNNIKDTIIDTLDETQDPATNEVKSIQESIVDEFEKSEEPLKTSVGKWDDIIKAEKIHIVTAARDVAQAAIDEMNKKFKAFKPVIGISIKVPDIKIPAVEAGTTLKGFTIAAPKLAEGGVVDKNILANIGEKGVPEMVAPLNERTLAPFAQMIAKFMGGNNSNNQIAGDYVLIPVNKRDLERELYMIRKHEAKRIAGRTV